MAENLAWLPEVCGSDAECGYWVYDYEGTDEVAAKATSNYTAYGVLYNYETALTACPTGWHLPTDYEWSFLEVHLGMSIQATLTTGSRGTNQGGKMKETGTAHWASPNQGATNISGFTGLPGGLRGEIGENFQQLGSAGFFWSSTREGNWVNYRHLYNTIEQVGSEWFSYYGTGDPTPGGSVRCVQD
jgi:uncharacterized protein (TIGR02145 family)